MKPLRSLLIGILIAVVSCMILIGGLVLSLVEGQYAAPAAQPEATPGLSLQIYPGEV